MENASDLLQANAEIFTRGKVPHCNKWLIRNVKVLVVGNRANTNAYIAMSLPHLPAKNFTAMLRLDHNRALSEWPRKPAQPSATLKNGAMGNHSPTMYADYRFATVNGQKVKDLINDQDWNANVFLPTVGKRGAAIIQARGLQPLQLPMPPSIIFTTGGW